MLDIAMKKSYLDICIITLCIRFQKWIIVITYNTTLHTTWKYYIHCLLSLVHIYRNFLPEIIPFYGVVPKMVYAEKKIRIFLFGL